MESEHIKDYLVVEFPDETKNGTTPMSVIPSNWMERDTLDNLTCWWPDNLSSNTDLNKAIVNRIVFKKEDCVSCKICIKFKTDTYESAAKRMKQLENVSSFSSTDEDISHKKRKSIRNRHLDDYQAGDSDSDDERPPAFSTPAPVTNQGNNSLKKRPGRNLMNTITHEKVENSQFVSQGADIFSEDLSDLTITNEPVVTFDQLNKCCKKTNLLVQNILTKQAIMSKDIEYILRLVQQMHSPVVREMENGHIKDLPAHDRRTLEQFDTVLMDDAVFSEVSETYAVVGGKDYTDSTRKILAKIISHGLALTINWSGRNDRIGFKNFKNIVKLITAVVRRNPMARNATSSEVETTIKQWLRSAGDRAGGRERRRTNN